MLRRSADSRPPAGGVPSAHPFAESRLPMNSADSAAARDPLRAHSDRIAGFVEEVGAATVAVLGRRGAIASGCVWRPGLVVTAAHVFRRTPAALTLVDAGGASLRGDARRHRLVDRPCPLSPSSRPMRPRPLPRTRCGAGARRPSRRSPSAAATTATRSPAPASSTASAGRGRPGSAASIDRLIRLDGGIYDGLSGAPVADAAGAVIGIATAALSRSYGIVVPSRDGVARRRRAARATAGSRGPWLGIGAQTVPLPEGAGAAAGEKSGLLVTSLAAGGPAERAGLLIGDIIVRAAEGAAANLRELRQALAAHVGQSVALAVLRGGAPLAAAGERRRVAGGRARLPLMMATRPCIRFALASPSPLVRAGLAARTRRAAATARSC